MSKKVPFQATLKVRDACLCLHVQRTARALARRFDEALRPAGLNNGQFSLLMALNRPEPPTIGSLARFLAMDRTTLTAALKPLRRDGLVKIAADPEDARGRRLSLTAKGHIALGAALPIWRETHRAIEAGLPALTPDALRAALVALCQEPGGCRPVSLETIVEDAFMARNQALRPASGLATKARKPFPGESAEYTKARTALLAEEIELRRHIERVAEQRRALPQGPAAKDYAFTGEDGKRVSLAEMFGDKDTLVVYFWMFGPQRERPCPMCTAFIGAMDVPARDIRQRVAMAIVGRSPIARQKAFKQERGWRNLPFHESANDDFAKDYRGLAPNGEEWPALLVFVKQAGKVHLFWASELGGTEDPGQDPRGAPDPTPLWNILDLTPGGRGADWYPKLEYAAE